MLDINELPRVLDAVYAQIDHCIDTMDAPYIACKKGCAGCCVDNLTVCRAEAEYISRYVKSNHIDLGKAHPKGACAFLDENKACKIYHCRPYVCRTQGYPLRWIEDDEEFRDICPLNNCDLTALPPERCWRIGPVETQLAKIEIAFFGNDTRRIPLRSLFRLLSHPSTPTAFTRNIS